MLLNTKHILVSLALLSVIHYLSMLYLKLSNNMDSKRSQEECPKCFSQNSSQGNNRFNPSNSRLGSKRPRYPDVIIIGSMKCGTGFLKEALQRHSKIVGTERGEVHFYNNLGRHDFGWYLKQMPKVTENVLVLEKTPHYFVDLSTAHLVSLLSSRPRVILSLRDPVERTISHYLHMLRWLKKDQDKSKSLEEHVTGANGRIITDSILIQFSLYATYLPMWLAFFKLDVKIHIANGDNMVKKPWEELIRIQQFLGLNVEISKENFVFSEEKGFYCMLPNKRADGKSTNTTTDQESDLRCLSNEKGHDHSKVLSEEFKKKLHDFYKPYNEQLFKMIGMRFNWTTVYN